MTIMFLQLVIILSTGEVNNTQLISLVISILSLSWGASRLTLCIINVTGLKGSSTKKISITQISYFG